MAAGRVHDHRVEPQVLRFLDRRARAMHRIQVPGGVVHAQRSLAPEHGQLLDRGRAAHVGRNQHRVTALARQPGSQLSGRGRLPRPLQAEQEDHARGRRARLQAASGVAEERDHLVAHDLDDLLRRREAAEDFLVERAVADAVGERLDDLEVDVRFEQRHADFAKRRLDGRFAQAGLAAQRPEDVLQPGAQ